MKDFYVKHRIYKREDKPVELSEAILGKISELVMRYPEGHSKSALIPVLHIVQEETGGSLDVAKMDFVASLLKLQPIEVYEVASFYTQFYLEPVGRYVIEVCQTGPCVACGAEDIVEKLSEILGIAPGETTSDGLFSLKTVECLGACGNAPVMQVNTEFHENLNPEELASLIASLKEEASGSKSVELKWAEKYSLKN